MTNLHKDAGHIMSEIRGGKIKRDVQLSEGKKYQDKGWIYIEKRLNVKEGVFMIQAHWSQVISDVPYSAPFLVPEVLPNFNLNPKFLLPIRNC